MTTSSQSLTNVFLNPYDFTTIYFCWVFSLFFSVIFFNEFFNKFFDLDTFKRFVNSEVPSILLNFYKCKWLTYIHTSEYFLNITESWGQWWSTQKTCFEKEIRSSFSHRSIDRSRDPCDSARINTQKNLSEFVLNRVRFLCP